MYHRRLKELCQERFDLSGLSHSQALIEDHQGACVHLRAFVRSITESVDSVCRDGTDMPYVAIQTEAWKTLLKQQL